MIVDTLYVPNPDGTLTVRYACRDIAPGVADHEFAAEVWARISAAPGDHAAAVLAWLTSANEE